MFSAFEGHTEIVEDLLKAGADVSAADKVHKWLYY